MGEVREGSEETGNGNNINDMTSTEGKSSLHSKTTEHFGSDLILEMFFFQLFSEMKLHLLLFLLVTSGTTKTCLCVSCTPVCTLFTSVEGLYLTKRVQRVE